VGLGLALVAAAACGSGSESPAGVGGSGGSGGAGGSAGASGGAGGASGTATYGAVCDAVESLSCWTGECDEYAQDTLDQAAEAGCTAQALAAFDCFADHTPICDPDFGFVEDPACTAATDAYLTCLRGGGACEQVGFLGKCGVFCGAAWGAQCDLDPNDSTWACLCRVGPKLGTSFTLPAVDKCDEALSAAQCAP
jgi:hypothetical protein